MSTYVVSYKALIYNGPMLIQQETLSGKLNIIQLKHINLGDNISLRIDAEGYEISQKEYEITVDSSNSVTV